MPSSRRRSFFFQNITSMPLLVVVVVVLGAWKDKVYNHKIHDMVTLAFPTRVMSVTDRNYRKEWKRHMDTSTTTFLSIPWNFAIEELARPPAYNYSGLHAITHIFKNMDHTRKHSVVFNQASVGQIDFWMAKASIPYQGLPACIVIFESRLFELYDALRLTTPLRRQFAVPLFRGTLETQWPKKHSGKVFVSLGTVNHSAVREEVRDVTLKLVASHTKRIVFYPDVIKFERWYGHMRNSEWAVMCSGTYPPTFMLYEAILLGTLPIFILTNTTPFWLTYKQKIKGELVKTPLPSTADPYQHMPFAGDDVDYRRFSYILRPQDFTTGLLETILAMPQEQVEEKRSYLRSVQERFTLKSSFDYMMRVTEKAFVLKPLFR